ncbi:MAG: flagellar assembly protein FliH [Rhodanobacter sp.]
MSNVLSRDKVVTFDRWEAPHVGNVAPAQSEPSLPTGPTVFELEEIQKQAHDEGYAAGLAEGRDAAKTLLDEQLARLDALCTAVARPLNDFDDVTEQELARLATVMARRVVGRELQLDPSLIQNAVREAAAALPSATRELRVWVHPDDLSLLQELGASEPLWRFGANAALNRGDCILDSTRSRLDARVDTRLAAVIDAVLGSDIDDGVDEVVA